MGEIFKLFGTIGIDNGEANKALDETTKKGQSTTSKLSGFFKKAAVAIGGVFAAKKLIDFGKLAVEAAAGAKALSAQFEQVFGDLQPQAQAAIDKMATEFGMVPNRLKPGMTKMTSMFKGLGMDTEEAMTKASDAVRLSADAAAFYDVSFEDANQSLSSFLKGNYEAGEAIGIFANDTQLAAFAIKNGVVKTTAEWQKMDEATKQATRLEYAKNMQELAGATGQASREADGYENVMGNIKQAWQDFLSVVGAPILGTVVNGLKGITEALGWAGDKVKEFQGWFSELTQEIQNSTAWNSLKDVMQPVAEAFERFKSAMGDSTFLADMAARFGEIKDAVLEIDFNKVSADLQAFIEKWAPLIAGIGAAATAFGVYTTALKIKSAMETIAIVSMYAMDAAAGILAGTMAVLTSPITWVIAAIGLLVAAGVALYQNWDTVSAFLSSTWETIKEVATTVFTAIGQFFSDLWNSIVEFMTPVIETIKNVITVGFMAIQAVIEGILTVIGAIFQTAWNVITAIFQNAMDAIKFLMDLVWALIGDKVTAVMTAISTVITTVWAAIQNVFTTVTTAIKNVVTTAWNAISSVTSSVFNTVKGFLSTVWNNIKSVVTTVVNAIKSVVSSVWNAISSVTSSVFNAIKSVVTNVWNNIKSAVTTAVNGVKSVVSSVWDAISSKTTAVFNSIKSTATSVWNSIKSAITTPIEAAKEKVRGIIDAIKGFFSGLKLKLPQITMPKLPHFSIKGSFSLTPPSVPHLGVEWYKDGGIMQKAMAFGMNGNDVMVGGEADKEAILPLNKETLGGIGAGIADTMGYSQTLVVAKLDELIERLEALFSQFKDMKVVMDGGELVGVIKEQINEVLGQSKDYAERGI